MICTLNSKIILTFTRGGIDGCSNKKNTWTPSLFRDYRNAEHDACGIVSVMEKRKIATKENIDLCIQSLVKMNHRAGFINGEGDGIGIHIDIPKTLWNRKTKK